MPLYIEQSGDLGRCYRCLTDSQTLKDRDTQLSIIKYKSRALVTQKYLRSLFSYSFHSFLLLSNFAGTTLVKMNTHFPQ